LPTQKDRKSEAVHLLEKLKEKAPEMYRHILGLIRAAVK